jgi:FSR family fosmidomycin resistance protein-like MFS transporter
MTSSEAIEVPLDQPIAINRRELIFLSTGHMLNDINQGAVPALIPFLVADRGLTITAAAGITLAATIISSFLQPLLGIYSDRKPLEWLIPIGMLTGAVGVAFTGLVSGYWPVILAVLLSGVGVAGFHPEGYRYANYVAGGQKTTGVGIFAVGGNLGFALGPLLMTFCILNWGFRGTAFMVIPAAIWAVVLFRELPRLKPIRQAASIQAKIEARPVNWNALVKLSIAIVLRSTVFFGLSTFVPLYLTIERGYTVANANSVLTIMAIGGALGTLVIGYVADRVGRKKTLIILQVIVAFMVIVFITWEHPTSIFVAALAGAGLSASFVIVMVLGQSLGGDNIGLVSGITTGLAIGMGGMASPLLGMVADHSGLTTTLGILAVLPVLSAMVLMTLPKIPAK